MIDQKAALEAAHVPIDDLAEEYLRLVGEVERLRTEETSWINGSLKFAADANCEKRKQAERISALEAALAVAREALINAPHMMECRYVWRSTEPCDCWKSRALAALEGR
jgi:hypothetical protein